MGLSELQSHITQNIPKSTEVVDLLKLTRGQSRVKNEPLKLVVDGECCLDRLYGGFYPDWVCGGQWNKMFEFLRNLTAVVQASRSLELIIFFNGSLEPDRLASEWSKRQEETNKFLEEICKHITHKKKPPPKIWWIPPTFLRSAVRLAFRSLQMKVMCSLDDHHKDLVRFCQRNQCDGIIADDPEYLLFDTQRYFSAQKLKLTFKGSLETVEVKLKTVFESLNLSKDKFQVFAALLGNHILTQEDLKDFFETLSVGSPQSKGTVIEKASEFVQTLTSLEPDKVGEAVAKDQFEKDREKARTISEKVLRCLRYYSDLNAKSNPPNKSSGAKKNKGKGSASGSKDKIQPSTQLPSESDTTVTKLELPETQISIEVQEPTEPVLANGQEEKKPTNPQPEKTETSTLDKMAYKVSSHIDSVAKTRHQNGLMSIYICQIFKYREIKLPVLIEDLRNNEIPRAHEIFRPLRQNVYAILFNLHHLRFLAKQRKEKVPTIQVKETFYSPQTKSSKTIFVNAVEIGWGVPTVERLWLGDGEECKGKRISAFMTIMKSDRRVILDPSFVPQELLALTCVLRYILSTNKVLRKHELDAFIAQAIIQEVTEPNLAQEIEVNNLTMRGVHLSHLFMEGVEMAMLANDACGAPIPFMLFFPWLFFNGKIFNYVLEQLAQGKTLPEICAFKMELVASIEQLRVAIIDGLKYTFVPDPPQQIAFRELLYNSPSPLINLGNPGGVRGFAYGGAGGYSMNPHADFGRPTSSQNYSNLLIMSALGAAETARGRVGRQVPTAYGVGPGRAGMVPLARGGGGNIPLLNYDGQISRTPRAQLGFQGRQRKVQARGGHLEVGGVVVGSWGANYGNPGMAPPPLLSHGGPLQPRQNRSSFMNSHQSANMTALFNQMQISNGNKLRTPVHPWYNKNKNGPKNQKKSIMKKNAGGGEGSKRATTAAAAATASNAESNGQAQAEAATNGGIKTKVSFNDEPKILTQTISAETEVEDDEDLDLLKDAPLDLDIEQLTSRESIESSLTMA